MLEWWSSSADHFYCVSRSHSKTFHAFHAADATTLSFAFLFRSSSCAFIVKSPDCVCCQLFCCWMLFHVCIENYPYNLCWDYRLPGVVWWWRWVASSCLFDFFFYILDSKDVRFQTRIRWRRWTHTCFSWHMKIIFSWKKREMNEWMMFLYCFLSAGYVTIAIFLFSFSLIQSLVLFKIHLLFYRGIHGSMFHVKIMKQTQVVHQVPHLLCFVVVDVRKFLRFACKSLSWENTYQTSGLNPCFPILVV